jgi:4-hydroxy-tetrahydrodipicolinate reductase
MTKIALIGYGKMGKMLENLATNFPIQIVAKIDPTQPECSSEITLDSLQGADVCIEFTHPGSVIQNIKRLCELHQNVVVGTTGWDQSREDVIQWVESAGNALLYGANMSIGMNLFYEIVSSSAALVSQYDEYDAFGFELHHRQKADSPSGTAKEISKLILGQMPAKTSALYEKIDRKIAPQELHFASIRAGYIPGTHTVGFDSEADTIELTHRVRNRTGFAMGALRAAIWLQNKRGLYSITDFIRSIDK